MNQDKEYMIDGGKKFATLKEATDAAVELVRSYDEPDTCSIWRLIRTVELQEAPISMTDYSTPPENRMNIVGPD